ncbi:MAG TPA: hypothetical protein VGN30_14700 [Steroidobacteraceae bacterium]|jgi:hypothetical protein
MDVDLTIRFSDDRLCEVIVCGPYEGSRIIGSSPAAQTSAKASPKRSGRRAAFKNLTLGPIGDVAATLKISAHEGFNSSTPAHARAVFHSAMA